MARRATETGLALLRSPWAALASGLLCALIIVLSAVDRLPGLSVPAAIRHAEEGIAGGSLARGKRELEAYMAEHPENDYALRLYGVTLLNLGEEEAGVEYLEKSIVLNPHQPGVVRYLESIGRAPEAAACPGASAEAVPGSP